LGGAAGPQGGGGKAGDAAKGLREASEGGSEGVHKRDGSDED